MAEGVPLRRGEAFEVQQEDPGPVAAKHDVEEQAEEQQARRQAYRHLPVAEVPAFCEKRRRGGAGSVPRILLQRQKSDLQLSHYADDISIIIDGEL